MANYTYTFAREHLAKVMERLVAERDIAVISRRGHDDIAMLPADELRSLQETAYLLRSPANAARLLNAIEDSASLALPRKLGGDLDRLSAAVKPRAGAPSQPNKRRK